MADVLVRRASVRVPMTPDAHGTVELDGPYDVGLSLPCLGTASDPTWRGDRQRVDLAGRTPEGPVAFRARAVDGRSARCVGCRRRLDGRPARAPRRPPRRPRELRFDHPVLDDANRRNPGMRHAAAGLVVDGLIARILGQRVLTWRPPGPGRHVPRGWAGRRRARSSCSCRPTTSASPRCRRGGSTSVASSGTGPARSWPCAATPAGWPRWSTCRSPRPTADASDPRPRPLDGERRGPGGPRRPRRHRRRRSTGSATSCAVLHRQVPWLGPGDARPGRSVGRPAGPGGAARVPERPPDPALRPRRADAAASRTSEPGPAADVDATLANVRSIRSRPGCRWPSLASDR